MLSECVMCTAISSSYRQSATLPKVVCPSIHNLQLNLRPTLFSVRSLHYIHSWLLGQASFTTLWSDIFNEILTSVHSVKFVHFCEYLVHYFGSCLIPCFRERTSVDKSSLIVTCNKLHISAAVSVTFQCYFCVTIYQLSFHMHLVSKAFVAINYCT